MFVTPATASCLLTFNSSWPKAGHTTHVVMFYKASDQTATQRHGEGVSFQKRAAHCCQHEQMCCATEQQRCLLLMATLTLRGHCRIKTSSLCSRPASESPCLQDLHQEKETIPAACKRENFASHRGMQTLNQKLSPGSTPLLPTSIQNAAI